jgi:hypothetical protein
MRIGRRSEKESVKGGNNDKGEEIRTLTSKVNILCSQFNVLKRTVMT